MNKIFKSATFVCASDFSPAARRAFFATVRLARAVGGRVHLLHVNDEERTLFAHGSADVVDFMVGVAAKRTEALASWEAEAGEWGVPVRIANVSGEAAAGILRYAASVNAGVIAMGLSGAGASHHLVAGSTTRRVLRDGGTPMLVTSANSRVREPGEGGSYASILYPTDLKEPSLSGVVAADRLAAMAGATLTIGHVALLPATLAMLPGEPPLVIPRTMHDMAKEPVLGALTKLTEGREASKTTGIIDVDLSASAGICSMANRCEADLIVIPTHNRGAIGRFFYGSVTEQLFQTAPVPVLTFPPAH